ncbi:hemolysin family protein [Paludibacter sp.]
MLVGNNIVLVIYGLIMADFMTPLFYFTDNQFIITFLQTVLATIIVLITGEFVPKSIFRINPNLWLNVFSWLIFIFYVLLYPIAFFTTWLSRSILRLFNKNNIQKTNDAIFTRVDLSYLIQESIDPKIQKDDIETEVKIFQNALDFSKIKLRDCLVPRTEIIALENETPLDVLKQTFIETGYSKIPIYKNNIDNIIGYIHASEMFEHPEEWRNYIKQVPIVPENMSAHKLMKLLMQQKKSMAVVVDEHGGTDGIITLEDIIEEIFGEIEDEHDTRILVAKKINEQEYLLSGRMEIQQVNEKFDLNIPESDEYDTIAGYILYHHQHFPKINEIIKIDKFNIKCIKVTNNRIELIKLFLGV